MSFERGFSLIEVLITAFVLATVTVAVTGLAMLSTRSAINSEQQNVAQAIANEKVENLRAVASTQGYDKVDYDDLGGVIPREEIVMRNDLPYTVEAFVEYVDDPANGTLPEGSLVTKDNADFTKVLYRVSWRSNLAGSDQPTSSSTVVAATFFANKANTASCTPGVAECPKCTPGTPAVCPDAQGEFTLDCPARGACEGEEQFAACPTSGKCSDVGVVSPPPESTPTPTPQPCSSNDECGDEGQCTNGQCEPEWCQNIGVGGGTAEVCSPEGCNDGFDNDGDGGIDVNGWDNNVDGDLNDPGDFPPDAQCVSMANEGGLYEWSGNCVRNDPSSATDCSGFESGYQIAPTTSQCVLFKSCGQRTLVSRACSVPACQPEPNKCQVRKGCADHQTCVDPDCFEDSDCPGGQECNNGVCGGIGKCSLNKPICLYGHCYECTAAPATWLNCPDINPELCDPFGPNPPPDGQCTCYFAKCAQCTSSRLNPNPNLDQDCESIPNSERNYCNLGECVECVTDANCDESQPPPPPGASYVCLENSCSIEFAPPPGQPQCSDGIDNIDPEDVLVDQADPGCITNGVYNPNDNDETDVPPPFAVACSDDVENDVPTDGKIDQDDPGCHRDGNANNPASYDPNWPTETDPEGSLCSDDFDNDGDGLVDAADPGCHSDGNVNNPGSYNPAGQFEKSPFYICDNGVDDELDGKIDYNIYGLGDPDCASPFGQSEGNPPGPPLPGGGGPP